MKTEQSEDESTGTKSDQIQYDHSMDLVYANQFSVDYYTEGYIHIHIEDGNEYVIVPDGKEKRNLGLQDVTYISQNSDSIYLAASSVMDLFRQMQGLDKVKACSTTSDDYSMQEIKDRINDGLITYVGKYSGPDYEALLGMECNLAIESTMIYRTPEIKEQLEKLGIPVFVDRSSYEGEPLGRLEWIKLYSVLLGKEEEAEAFFEEKRRAVEELEEKLAEAKEDREEKTVVFFYITSNGYVNVRKPGDYLSKMIKMAGGGYALENLDFDENALSTMNINWEDFYREAKDADILIYNGTIDGGIKSIDDLISKNELFNDFKAVKEKNVWSTNLNMYQETSKITDIIQDLYYVINEDGVETEYMNKLK
ncbi:MAG: ABC transporter substrate-binding protein [Eubacterium sp.]|nr:ABC transporter substrate-binding protein [Eubacterium sp.]